jgi:opacity protein-like surface antigen
MNNKAIVLLAASLLATSALASEGTSNMKHHHKHTVAAPVVVAPVAAVEPAAEMKSNFAVIEGTYNFNIKKLKFANTNYTTRKVHNGGSFGLGLGMHANENVSVDATFSYVLPAKTKLTLAGGTNNYLESTVKTDSYRLMFNGRYTMHDVISSGVSPFVTAGIGGSYNHTKADASAVYNSANKADSASGSKSENNFQFAYQVGAGLTVKASDDVNVDLAYRFSDNGKMKNIKLANDRAVFSGRNLQSHQVLLGLRVAF